MATPERRKPWTGPFLEALSRLPNVSAAARAAGVNRATAYRERSADPEFAEGWDDAIETALDLMEQVAARRATVGEEHRETRVHERVVNGEVVERNTTTTDKLYRSDTLLIFLLKAHRPSLYRETSRYEVTGDSGGPIQIAPATVDEAVETFRAEVIRLALGGGEGEGDRDRGEEGDPA